MMEPHSLVKTCKPPAPYLGGKSKLAERIVNMINQIPHKTYAEVFVGMGGIFFSRDHRPKAEIINDYSQDVSNLFRILQRHFVPFMEMLKWQLSTRADFDRLIMSSPETLTDLERAARFLYLQRTAFGGKISGRNFGTCKDRPARFDLTKLASVLEDIHERLSSVTVESLDYKAFIQRYDYADCLFYLDPPYYGCEKDYGKNMFSREEFSLMANLLKNLNGRFILSLNDRPEVRKIFKDFTIISVETVYTVSKTGPRKPVGEVLITNVKGRLKLRKTRN